MEEQGIFLGELGEEAKWRGQLSGVFSLRARRETLGFWRKKKIVARGTLIHSYCYYYYFSNLVIPLYFNLIDHAHFFFQNPFPLNLA